jgi:hypothetical protein
MKPKIGLHDLINLAANRPQFIVIGPIKDSPQFKKNKLNPLNFDGDC